MPRSAALHLAIFLAAVLFGTNAFGQSTPGSDDWNYEVSKAIAISLSETPAWEYAMPYLREIGPRTTDWSLLLFQSKVEHQRGDIEAADKTIQRALKSAPNNPRVLAMAANIAADLGRHDEAIVHFENARSVQPNNAAVLLALGRIRFARREWANVIELYEPLVTLVPTTSEICVRLATAYENIDDLDNAEKYLKKNLSIHPNRLLALIPMERFYRRHGMIRRADDVAQELRKLQYHDHDRREMRALQKSSR